MDKTEVLLPAKSDEEVTRLLEQHLIPSLEADVSKNGDNDPGPPPAKKMKYSYGTAGFRYDASVLESVMVRVGILAAVRSIQKGGEAVGVMVTASHNDESYNGVKVADPDGGMMGPDGEALAVPLANTESAKDVMALIQPHLNSNNEGTANNKAVVHIGRDTRSHSPALTKLVIETAQAMGATVIDHGIVTTPQLHHAVAHANSQYLPLLIPPRPNLVGYYDLVCHSYHSLLLTLPEGMKPPSPSLPLVVDCACGVGYAHVQEVNKRLQELSPAAGGGVCRTLMAVNGPGNGPLNTNCGSEYVQKSICAPEIYKSSDVTANNISYGASLDGDADRIVFFKNDTSDDGNSFCLLDGDKIAVLICDFLQEQVDSLLNAIGEKESPSSLRLGVVQTAYANGASTQYMKKVLGDHRVEIAKTGVKYVHAAAHEHFDIGVYFEANGHGTVLFGAKFYEFLAKVEANPSTKGHVALRRLALLPSLVNQAVGDAISDLLLVDAILTLKQWNIDTWNNLYQDLPSRQCKVKVEDRSMIKTNENETRAIAPDTLQPALDEAMKKVTGSRCFVRPSGTENVVRVYAEATTTQDADALATTAAQLVHSLCRGIGEPPSFG